MSKELVTKTTDIITMGIEGLSQHTLPEITLVASAVDRADKMVKLAQGIVLVAARSKHKDNETFGKYRETIFPDMKREMAGELMNLARFFTPKRPMKEIKITAAMMIAAPKNKEIASVLYDKVKDVAGGATVKKVTNLIANLNKNEETLGKTIFDMIKTEKEPANLGETLSEIIEKDIENEQKVKQKENQKKESPISDPIVNITPIIEISNEREIDESDFKEKVNGDLNIEKALLLFGIRNEAAFLRNDPLLGGLIEVMRKYFKDAYDPDNAGDSYKFSLVDKAADKIKKHYNV